MLYFKYSDVFINTKFLDMCKSIIPLTRSHNFTRRASSIIFLNKSRDLPNGLSTVSNNKVKKNFLFSQSLQYSLNNIIFINTNVFKGKIRKEYENEYAHSIMEDLAKYNNCVVKHPLDNIASGDMDCKILGNLLTRKFNSPHELVSCFSKLSIISSRKGLRIEDYKFDSLINALVKSISIFNDNQLMQVLSSLCLWPPAPSTTSPHFKILWNTLDIECKNRLSNWTTDFKLLIADYWFHLRLSRISKYNSAIIIDLITNPYNLTESQIVQLMFFVNVQRIIPKNLITLLEKRLIPLVNTLSVEELGIICLGFFKTKTKMQSYDLMALILNRTTSQIEHLNSLTVAAIVKCLRKSSNIYLANSYGKLLDNSVPFICKWGLPAVIHIALLSSDIHTYHPLVLDAVAECVNKQIQSMRMKDITKFIFCLSLFNHLPKNKGFLDLLLNESRSKERKEEIHVRPYDFISALLFCAVLGHYPVDILKTVLDPAYVAHTVEVTSLPVLRNFASLDYSIEIECCNYDGPRLHPDKLKVLRQHRGNIPDNQSELNYAEKLILEIYTILSELLGSNHNICIKHILPHFFTPDILFRLGSNDCAKSLSEMTCNYSPEDILRPPADQKWACIIACGKSCYAYKSEHLLGITKMKIRQLQKIGYQVIEVPWFEFEKCLNSQQQKKYLQQKLKLLN